MTLEVLDGDTIHPERLRRTGDGSRRLRQIGRWHTCRAHSAHLEQDEVRLSSTLSLTVAGEDGRDHWLSNPAEQDADRIAFKANSVSD